MGKKKKAKALGGLIVLGAPEHQIDADFAPDLAEWIEFKTVGVALLLEAALREEEREEARTAAAWLAHDLIAIAHLKSEGAALGEEPIADNLDRLAGMTTLLTLEHEGGDSPYIADVKQSIADRLRREIVQLGKTEAA